MIARNGIGHHRDQARDDFPAEVLDWLDGLETAAIDAGREGSALEIRMLQALAHHADGDLAAAMAAVCRALGEAPEPDSYVRIYLDEGTPAFRAS